MDSGLSKKLGVIIVSWNVRDILLSNLHSLFQGNDDADFEVVVVDNGSSDGTVEAVRRQFPQVTVIANKENRGFAVAVNQGIEAVNRKLKTENDTVYGLRSTAFGHILLLNPDMRVESGAIAKTIEYLERHPDVAVVSGKLIDESGKAMHHMRRFPTFKDQLLVITKIGKFFPAVLKMYYAKDLDTEKEQTVDSVRGSFFAINKTALEKIGKLDERYFIWFEEVDYCRQAKEKGMKVMYVPSIIAHDLVGKSFAMRNLYWKQKQVAASMIRYFKKWHPRWQAVALQILWQPVLAAARIVSFLRRQESMPSISSHGDYSPLLSGRNDDKLQATSYQLPAKLAIQLVTYHSSKHLEPLLESLKNQTFKDFKLFVLDNSEDEEEAQKIKVLLTDSAIPQSGTPVRGASYPAKRDPGTRGQLQATSQNLGFAGGHARLFSMQDSPFVLLINDDAKLDPSYLEILMSRMESDPGIGSMTGLIYRWDGKTIDTAGLEYKCLAQIVDRFAGQELPATSYKLQASEVFGISGAVALYRRSAVEEAGGLFESSWFMYKEDADLALRLHKAGYKSWFEPKAVGYHKRGLKREGGLWRRFFDEWKRPAPLRVYAYANQLRIYKRHWREIRGVGDALRSMAIESARSAGTFLMSPKVFFKAWQLVLSPNQSVILRSEATKDPASEGDSSLRSE